MSYELLGNQQAQPSMMSGFDPANLEGARHEANYLQSLAAVGCIVCKTISGEENLEERTDKARQ